MFKTEQEIFSQYEALEKTYAYMLDNADTIRKTLDSTAYKSLTFIGSGSSYSLCKSAQISVKLRRDIQANALPAGDLMLNFPHYAKLMKDTLLIAPSRSGSTSEVVMAARTARDQLGVPCIAISMVKDSELSKIAVLSLEIPWAFDESVCQTRTVTNLYLTNLMLIAIMLDDKAQLEEIRQAVANGKAMFERYTGTLKEIGSLNGWDRVVVLADSELEGIAEEGSLAFKEICQLPSNYFHLLDVRHGPMVLIDGRTLVIAVCTPFSANYQRDLIRDIKKCGATVVTVSNIGENPWGSDYNVTIPDYENYGVWGIPFILVPQIIAYFKAISRGINPDLPRGLDPWIKL